VGQLRRYALVASHVARARDEQRPSTAGGPLVQTLGERRVPRALHEHHRVEHALGQKAAVRLAHLVAHGGLKFGRQGRGEPERLDQRRVEGRDALVRDAHRCVPVETRRQDRAVSREGSLEHRAVDRPRGPARRIPLDRLGERVGVARVRGEAGVDRGLLLSIEHLEDHRWGVMRGRKGLEQRRLEPVMIRIVVGLADEHDVGPLHACGELRFAHAPPGRDIHDHADQRVVGAVRALPPDRGGLRLRWRGPAGPRACKRGKRGGRDEHEAQDRSWRAGAHAGTS
jgi:hypothetical protein